MKFIRKALIGFIAITIFLTNPIPTLAKEGNILFFNDFNSGNLDSWTIESGNWSINNGKLVGSKSGNFSEGTIKIGNLTWSNYRLELDVNSFQGIDQSIGFRYTQNENYGINLRYSNGTGYYDTPQIKLWKNTNNSSAVPLQTHSVPLINNNWYHIRVDLFNEHIKVWIDNTLIFDFTDQGTTVKKGPIILNYWTGNIGIANMGFDNVKVTALLPDPFLDLPWDYSGKGLNFNEAAMSIYSFFDHQYPLLSRGLDLSEPTAASTDIVDYLGRTINSPYTKHDGYDYGNLAKIEFGDPVLAAASGSAIYINSCSPCGNMIIIDHGNGYQTKYMHLQNDNLIINIPNQPVPVNNHQQIGKVGLTGTTTGPHIHFSVFRDKNSDGDFNDNEPDGVTDPFGWQSDLIDPWENYTFNYLGQNRTGNSSNYLWVNKLASMTSPVTPSGTTLNAGNYNVTFPQNATNQNIVVDIKSTPVVKPSNNIVSLGSTLLIKATDSAGNAVTQIQNLYNIVLDFSSLDLSKIKTDTLSFYSSFDGVNWIKENTSFLTPTKAQTQINHMSYFALIGERIDTTVPLTETIFTGTKSQPSWFRSDVQLTLDAKDNEGGLGVEYTLYRINDGETQIYSSPLSFTNEGHYKVEFYSADNDDNIEDRKSIEFNIDKTLPEARIYFDDQKKDLAVIGIDDNQTIVTTENSVKHEDNDNKDEDENENENKDRDNQSEHNPSKKIYKITDQAGNILKINLKDFELEKEGKSATYSLRFNSLKYNDRDAVFLPKNQYLIKYEAEKKQIKLVQEFGLKDKVKIRIRYNSKLNKSEIYTVNDDKEKLKETKDGLVILTLTTNKGNLEYNY